MLIRSQDKEMLVNLDNVATLGLSISDGFAYIRAKMPGGHNRNIGKYSTKERALEALNRVQEAYTSSLYCDHAYDFSAQVNRPYLFANNTVFQMPSDEEV